MGVVKKSMLSALAVLLLAVGLFAVPTIWLKPWSIDHFYARVFVRFALRHPMMLSSMRLLEPMGLDFHNNDLDDFSIAFQEREVRWVEDELEMLRRYDRAALDDAGALSYDILEWFMADQKQGNRWPSHGYPVNQLGGIQSGLPDFMINTHHLEAKNEAEDYIARVGQFGRVFDQVLEDLALREELGVVPPRFVIDHVLAEMRDLIAPSPTEMVLYTHFAEKLAEMEDVDEATADALSDRLAGEIRDTVVPSYERLIRFFERQSTTATTDDGVWKLPDGEAFYNWTLRHHTTTDLTAQQIHDLGLYEVDRLQAEMRTILEAEGYPTEDLAATMNGLNEEERFLYPDTDEGRQQIMVDFQTLIDEIDGGLGELFDVRPASSVQVERVPEFRQATAPGAYYDSPPFDGSKPGTFYINLRSVEEIPKFGMRTLAYHEAIPGHHFQIAITQELEDVPFFRRVIPFTAYVEGWALYAEHVAAENGFQADPYDHLGYLTAQLFRAVRLVVDTGIHAKRWTREEAIEYMLAN
ncbi:MAG: DUF885 domain-containing protein, partial [Acidobacteria bacterium]|nr:DUF885 domain-containing protein [Acidobacteriota bacterium]